MAVVEGGGPLWRGGGWWRFDCTSIKFVTKRFYKNSTELNLMKFLVKSQIVISYERSTLNLGRTIVVNILGNRE